MQEISTYELNNVQYSVPNSEIENGTLNISFIKGISKGFTLERKAIEYPKVEKLE